MCNICASISARCGKSWKPINHGLRSEYIPDPNAEVAPIHPKAMPVILTTPEEIETWMTAPTPEALKLQRALPDGSLRIVARGEKKDGALAEV